MLYCSRFLVLFALVFGPALRGQAQAQPAGAPLFVRDFEAPAAVGEFSKRWGQAIKHDSVTIVDEGSEQGNRSARISFVPVSGKYWYFAIPTDLRADPEQLLKLGGHFKFAVAGRLDPLLAIRIGLSYNIYTDATYTDTVSRGMVHYAGALYTPGAWERFVGEPFNLTRKLAAKGKDHRHLKITAIMVMVINQPVGQQLDIWVDDLTLAHATQADVDAYNTSIQVDFTPRPCEAQTGRFYYGYTGGLYSGWNKWARHLMFMPKEKRALNNLEFMLKGNFTQVLDYGHKLEPDGSNVAQIVRDIALLHDYGVSAVSVCYLTPYYSGQRSLEECEAAIRGTVPVLAKTPGLSGYLVIDEPRPDRQTMELWVWTKKLFRELDPRNPASGPLNTLDRIRYYTQTEHTVWLDQYTFRGDCFDSYEQGTDGVLSLEVANRLAYEHGAKQVWNMNAVFSRSGRNRGSWRMPSPVEHRLTNYISLGNGARTIQYFSMNGFLPHTSPRRGKLVMPPRILGFGTSVGAPAHPAGRELFAQRDVVPVYGPVLMPTTWEYRTELPVSCAQITTVSPNKNAIGIGYNKGARYDVVVVYNRDVSRAQSGTVALTKVLKGRRLYDLAADREIAHDGGVFRTAELAPGDGRIYVLATPTAYRQVAQHVARTRYSLLKRLFDFTYREQRHNSLDMRAFTERFETTTESAHAAPALALATLRRAYAELKEREEATTTVFGQTHRLLKAARTDYVAVVELQARHLARPEPELSALINAEDYREWEEETIRLGDIYVLLRNLLYFGRTAQALPLARTLALRVAALLRTTRAGRLTPVDPTGTRELHQRALALNDFDLLTALEQNVR